MESAIIGMDLESLHQVKENAPSRSLVSYFDLGNLASELRNGHGEKFLWIAEAKISRRHRQNWNMQSIQTCSEGKGAQWKLESRFFYDCHPILSCLDNLQ